MYNNTQQIITGTVVIVSTVLLGFAVWSFYGKGKGGASPVRVVTEKL